MKRSNTSWNMCNIEGLESRTLLSAAAYAALHADASTSSTESASATISATLLSSGDYQYSITLKDAAKGRATSANQIGTFWFAWIPGEDFLATSPTSVSSPTGWTDKITNDGPSDGFAIQWTTSTDFVAAKKSLGGFVFTSADTPSQVFGKSAAFPSTLATTSFVYSGAPFSDAGFKFTATPAVNNPTGALLPELPVSPLITGTTVPANGDVNPYGVAFVPKGFPAGGATSAGDLLVSNFNDSNNLQGTGTTIVSVSPAGATTTFYQGPAGEGLSTALGVLKNGFVLVGNVPSTDGTAATVGQGSLIVLDKTGTKVAEFTDPALLDGPWDLTVVDKGATAKVFVSNVLSGTVSRLDLKVSKSADTVTLVHDTQIASGYQHGPNEAAFELGPTGLAYSASNNTLYIASTQDNEIFAIKSAASRSTDAGTGTLIYQDDSHLRGPLALAIAPNGDLITANGDAVNDDPTQPSELVEFTPKGVFVDQQSVDSSGEGGAFGLALSAPQGKSIFFAAVDDLTNSLDIWTLDRSSLMKHHGK